MLLKGYLTEDEKEGIRMNQTKKFIDISNPIPKIKRYTRIKEEKDFQYNAPNIFKIIGVQEGNELTEIHFQEGHVKEEGINGITDEDLILILIRRLEYLQESNDKCIENEKMIEKLKETLMWNREKNK